MTYGEATYWHNNPDLARLAQNMRERLEQPTTVHPLWTQHRLTCR
jgi:hypothetical protein